MAFREDLIYRQVFTLKDGVRVLVRPLVKDDRQALLDLFLPVGPEEKRYIRHDINDPEVIEGWIDELNYETVLPLVAEVNNHLIGVASLHFREGPARHRAEVRIFLAKNYRQRGVGTRMLSGLIEMARKRGLDILEVEIVSDQSHLVKAFQNLGFQTVCTLEDFFMLPDGDLLDIHLMVLRLHVSSREF
jgi:L-amino acid N-acyltransferase YncA